MEFIVSVCLGRGDGGDVCVDVEVSDEEYELLKDCCREYEDIDGFDGLEGLCGRIKEVAKEENENCMTDYESEDVISYDNVSYIVRMPEEIENIVESEDNSDDDDENEDAIDWYDFSDYPFAMEIVNGEIISLTAEFQRTIREKLIEVLDSSEDELKKHLVAFSDGEEDGGDRFWAIISIDGDALAEILGFDLSKKTFVPEGIGFLGSKYGWEAKELLGFLKIPLDERINTGPHGHGTNGVVFISQF